MSIYVNLSLDEITRTEIASMIYSRWSEAFDALKKTKSLTWESAGKFCPKTEWSLYHAEMIKQAEMEFELATKLKNDICKYSPLVMGS